MLVVVVEVLWAESWDGEFGLLAVDFDETDPRLLATSLMLTGRLGDLLTF